MGKLTEKTALIMDALIRVTSGAANPEPEDVAAVALLAASLPPRVKVESVSMVQAI